MINQNKIGSWLLFSLLLSNSVFAGYLVDSSGKVVLDSAKECWQGIWTDPGMSTICGDKAPEPEMKHRAVKPKPMPVAPVYGDSDGDGVRDNLDRCPNSQTADVDTHGCARDNDKDDVANYLDDCLSTPMGVKVDSKGCQIIENINIQLGVAGFDVNSANLRPAMMSKLDDIADQVMQSSGNEQLSVIGHTDQYGTDSYNQSLSEKRAAAVVDYLAGKGIDRGMMTSSGMGESSPIADINTREGRAKNRRVEITTK